ncbi:hypothetical protein WN944_007332 [Citrus x changshan-huyou]|uniref:NB-ARC domain-containing protein n=1 Tax=Citrus x changshan-huyou TaxID=2935761 RepID=A0AAP0QXY8_9ROSI
MNIQKAVSDPDVSIFGVYGRGGIGKTILAKPISRQAKKDKLLKLKNTATKVANACGGLPIAITTMARAFRNKSDHE